LGSGPATATDRRAVEEQGWRARLRPEEALFALFLALLGVIMAATRTFRLPSTLHARFVECVAAGAALVLARGYVRARSRLARPAAARAALVEAATLLRDFAPFFGVLLLYETLHDLTPLLRPHPVDETLARIDRAVLGVDAAVWLGRFATPTLTRAMVLCYASYFVAPALLATAIYASGERACFRGFMVAGALTSMLGYAGYLAVPAVGPYVHQAALFPTRLPGGGPETHLFIAAIDDLRGVARDCFPSLHTAHTTVVLVFARRWRRAAFLGYLPIALGLYVSTVYLRMHWVVDVAAGFATAALAVWIAPRLERWWSRWQGAEKRRFAP
jgi:membrane-associated phospholipid phosphatase